VRLRLRFPANGNSGHPRFPTSLRFSPSVGIEKELKKQFNIFLFLCSLFADRALAAVKTKELLICAYVTAATHKA
jgi:hypothetical protein